MSHSCTTNNWCCHLVDANCTKATWTMLQNHQLLLYSRFYCCHYHYFHQWGHVIIVCLSASNFAQELPNGFAQNFHRRLAMGQQTMIKMQGGRYAASPGKKSLYPDSDLDQHQNPDHCLDTGIFFQIGHYWRYGKRYQLTGLHDAAVQGMH